MSRSLFGGAATLLLAGLCIAGATAPAAAHTTLGMNQNGERVATVSHADLDLGSKAGRARLETRIREAARKVCTSNDANPWKQAQESQCIQEAVKNSRHAVMAAAETRKAS
jgi:UrcA family protein